MTSPRVVVLGAGFAGLAAVRELAGIAHDGAQVILVDRHPFTTMVPALPDVAGGRLDPAWLTAPVKDLIDPAVTFRCSPVESVNLDTCTIGTKAGDLTYDHLVIATGSVTNLFGFDQHLEAVHTLDTIADAKRIRREFQACLEGAAEPTALVVGGGYTGLELACNLKALAHRQGRGSKVLVIELKDTILPGMDDKVRTYLQEQCNAQDIRTLTGCSVDAFDGRTVTLSSGQRLDHAFLCWATGTRRALADVQGNPQQLRDGRLIVDECLRLPEHPCVYAAGDSAAIRASRGDAYLRKSVNYAIYSGKRAGGNVAETIRGRAPRPFIPFDPGWVIPFCRVGVGRISPVGFVKGRVPLALHYLMCGYRNYTMTNRAHFLSMSARTLTGRL